LGSGKIRTKANRGGRCYVLKKESLARTVAASEEKAGKKHSFFE
jgi:hypothetical protein